MLDAAWSRQGSDKHFGILIYHEMELIYSACVSDCGIVQPVWVRVGRESMALCVSNELVVATVDRCKLKVFLWGDSK